MNVLSCRAALRRIALISFLVIPMRLAQADEPPRFVDGHGRLLPFAPEAGRVLINERSDFSRYENGRYVGLSARQSQLSLTGVAGNDGSMLYGGEVFVLEETLRESRLAAGRIRETLPVRFSVLPGGTLAFREDPGYPILRGMPSSPPEAVQAGQRWTGEASVVVRPIADAPATRIRVAVEYEYRGTVNWEGGQALSILARYAVRLRPGDGRADPLGDPLLVSAQGGRSADILVDPRTGSTLFIRETVDETFVYSGGLSVRLKGFILHFHSGSLPGERALIASALSGTGSPAAPASMGQPQAQAAGASPGGDSATPGETAPGSTPQATAAAAAPSAAPSTAPSAAAPSAAATGSAPLPSPGEPFQLAESERGVVLILYDLRFQADSAKLLAGEEKRLDAIADALKRLPGRTFLVEGHTADLGRPQGQYELSEARAKSIVDALVARGIAPSKLLYQGRGADKPVAPNDTEANRARNRRVEITVLD